MDGTSVKITWSAPADGSLPILKYRIKILQSDGSTLTEDLANCDGSDESIKTNNFCTVPMSVLTATPYSLA